MKINYEFAVGVPLDQAWNRMLDLERIAPCLPGAAIQEERDDGDYAGTMKVEIGPVTVSYKGTVKFEETDETNHRAVLQATGRETRGQGTASATIISTLEEEGDDTRVNVEADMKLTGRAAQFGRGIAQDVATKMLDQFAACLEREISDGGAAVEATAPAEPAAGNGPQTDTPGEQAPPAVAGGTVEGAVVAGSSPSEAAAGAPTTSTRQPTTQETPRREPSEQPEAFNSDAASRDVVLNRLPSLLAGAGVLLVLFWLFRRER